MHKQLDVKNYFYFEGVLLGGWSHGHDVSTIYHLVLRDLRGEVLEKDLGSTGNSKELIVEWEQPRLQLRRGASEC